MLRNIKLPLLIGYVKKSWQHNLWSAKSRRQMKSSSPKDHKFKEVESEKNATAKWTSTHLLNDKDNINFLLECKPPM